MTFIRLMPRGRSEAVRSEAAVTCALHQNNHSRSVYLTFSHATIERLGWNPDKDRILILEGTGRDAGFIKAVPGDGPGSLKLTSAGGKGNGTRRNRGMIVKLAATNFLAHRLPTETQPAIEVVAQLFGSEAMIILPSWAQPIEESAP